MKSPLSLLPTKHVRLGIASVAAVGLLVALPLSSQAASKQVPLGTAESFVVLAGSGITSTGPTTLNGDLGTYPTKTVNVTGEMTVTGTKHAGDGVAKQAKADLVTAYDATAGQGPTSPISGDLNGMMLKPGVYNSSTSMGLRTGGTLTLDAAGDPDAVFVFQTGSTLKAESGSKVLLRNGARSCNVVWQVGSSTTIGTNASFVGTVLSMDSITLETGAKVIGRALARNGAVTLDQNVITRPTSCVASAAVTPQSRKIPTGAVSTGDGSTSTTSGASGLLGLMAGVLAFAGIASAAVFGARRRRHNG